MSQSCQSVPPLNLDEYDYEDDLNQEMSLKGIGIGVPRFSDITIDERKDRIRNLVNEIYSMKPISEGNHTRRSLNQNLRRYASVDSDISSVVTASTMRPQRTSHPARLTRAPSYASSISKAAQMRKYASSPKLNNPTTSAASSRHHPASQNHISVQNLGPLTSATSMVNLKAKKNSLEEHVNKHKPLKKNSSAPMAGPRPNDQPVQPPPPPPPMENDEFVEPIDEDEIDADTVIENMNNGDVDEQDNLEVQSVVRGSDIDYIRANIHCASSVGHVRRLVFLHLIFYQRPNFSNLFFSFPGKRSKLPRSGRKNVKSPKRKV